MEPIALRSSFQVSSAFLGSTSSHRQEPWRACVPARRTFARLANGLRWWQSVVSGRA